MASDRSGEPTPRSRAGGLLPYALGNIGGTVAYLPLLTLLLPLKVAALAGEARLGVLATCAVAGSVAAGGSNVLFGWLGDRSAARGRGRRGWLIGGTAVTTVSLGAIALADTAATVVAAIVVFQVAVNALLAQVSALMAEEVPDERKGAAAGLLALGPPVAAGVSALLVASAWGEGGRLAIVAGIVAACVVPLAWRQPRVVVAPPPPRVRMRLRRDLGIAWSARLLMQVAGCAIQLDLLYYFQAIAGGHGDATGQVATLLLLGAAIPGVLAIPAGRWSDRTGRRGRMLLGCAALAAAGLVAMALARDGAVGATGFIAFATGSTIFLVLNVGLAMQLLPDPARRGRDLGLLNLANTLPSTIGPLLAWGLASADDFAATLLVLAALALAAGVMTLAVRER